jgi:hypothetical protein
VGAATVGAGSATGLGVETAERDAESVFDGIASLMLDVELGAGALMAGDELAGAAFGAGLEAGAGLRAGPREELPASATATGALSRAASVLATGAGVDSLDAVLAGSVTGAGCAAACGALISLSLRA